MLGDLLPLLIESSLSKSVFRGAPWPRDSSASLLPDLSSGASELHAECEGLLGVSPKVKSVSTAARPLTWAEPLPAFSGAAKGKSGRWGGCSTMGSPCPEAQGEVPAPAPQGSELVNVKPGRWEEGCAAGCGPAVWELSTPTSCTLHLLGYLKLLLISS